MGNEDIELKAYKLLAQIRGSMLSKITFEARNRVEYDKDKPEKSQLWMEYISNPDKWDYCGILSKEDKHVLETIEYLLNDDYTEIRRYKGWNPPEQ